jgi:hypothetical protein
VVFSWNLPTTSPLSIRTRVGADSAWAPAKPAAYNPINAPENLSRMRTSRILFFARD